MRPVANLTASDRAIVAAFRLNLALHADYPDSEPNDLEPDPPAYRPRLHADEFDVQSDSANCLLYRHSHCSCVRCHHFCSVAMHRIVLFSSFTLSTVARWNVRDPNTILWVLGLIAL